MPLVAVAPTTSGEISAMSLEKVMCVPAMCATDRAYTVKM